MKIRRILPPSGAEVTLRALISATRGLTWPSNVLVKLENSLKDIFQAKYAFLLCSGRAALTVILRALSDITGRDEVIVPSYTCFSVPASVVRAGLKVVVCDVGKDSADYDTRKLQPLVNEKTLCIIANHLFGIPSDVDALMAVARTHGSFVLEDCAQAMGATMRGKPVGCLGDVAFFSAGRGKNVYLVSAGLIITADERIAWALARRISRLPAARLNENIKAAMTAFFIYLFSRPFLYWLPYSLPFLKIGTTLYSTDFPIARLPAFNAGFAERLPAVLRDLTESRRKIGGRYRRKLMACGFHALDEPIGASAAYPRFPVLAHDGIERETIYRRLTRMGMGATMGYPAAIPHIPQLQMSESCKRDCPNGEALAKLLITLPTHRAVSCSDMRIILEVFEEHATPSAKELSPLTNAV
ncbi:MAG: hypothetical protein C4520_10985 [Candidatus Abyssobacteria bacterium SURF_5]|uniref:Aminotransferase DegT n=1 Tax=Abyssobacteria bacterium (strain SURF_5) TaxID=2093360 RepID=A0A3A4NIS5_ABYX5|nr:MAG: hypothetical protein C4520_10985 [Candidatus Abyssubacteria bacterium SURF_5]